MTGHMWAALLVGLILGGVIGFRLGVLWLPSLLGKMAAFGIRRDIKTYRRRKR